jgi:hypothetical protein
MNSAENNTPTIFELNVPSGTLVVGNDFRGHFRILGDFDINGLEGTRKTIAAMAAIGCAHGYVGNSCPGVYQTRPDTFIIAVPGEEEEPVGTQVASICTDLWWYSIVDYDEFKRRGCEGKYDDAQLVSTKPGVYRFTHHHSETSNYEKSHIYTQIEWVREPDPVKDYDAAWKKQNFTAGQVIARSIGNYPSLYSGSDGVRRVAEHIFCVTGGGGDWHENGFVLYDPELSPDQKEVDVPTFSGTYDWYPLSKYSSLCCAAGIGRHEIRLNPSFLALAYNVANCIVQYGCRRHPENVEIAKRCIEGLDKRYGQTLPAEKRLVDPGARE